MAARRRIERKQLKRAINAIKSVCVGHDHHISSVPLPVQNAMLPIVLLEQYFREKCSNVKGHAQYQSVFEVLFNVLILERLKFYFARDAELLQILDENIAIDDPFLALLSKRVRAFLKSWNNQDSVRLFNSLHDFHIPLLSERMWNVVSSFDAGGTRLTSANIQNIYVGINIIDDIRFQQAYLAIVAYAIRACNSDYANKELRKFRLMSESANGIRYLTPKGCREAENLISAVDRWHSSGRINNLTASEEQSEFLTVTASLVDLLSRLQSMPPDTFECLCQQLLLKSGVEDVEVTGRTGDDGIDGQGIIRLEGLTSIPVVFQAKRYSGSVGVSAIRDFRGAMDGRASTGFLMTTGSFTNQAWIEAERAGATKIDLIDGDKLVTLLKTHDIDLE